MKIMFLTSGDQTFLPEFYERVFATIGQDVSGLAIVSDPHFKRFLWNSLSFMGLKTFAGEAGRQIIIRIKNLLYSLAAPSKIHSIKIICGKYNVSCIGVKWVNSRKFREYLSEKNVNLIVSIACPQILKKSILKIPSNGCINVHYGLLPEYRGMYPSFWALANGETETGVSVHYMAEKVDAGDIIVQLNEKIKPDDSFYTLVRRLKTTIGPEALIKAVDKIKKGDTSVIKNDISRGTYYSFPTKAAMSQFRARGRKWF
ncbi:MAG: hypothetical protein JSW64_11335 [Candidatus Zixiibacteriota bacterium]|nr:MAG: hypothetical protein JSW64_11335 [candidate division Zixibacteria bacterium]